MTNITETKIQTSAFQLELQAPLDIDFRNLLQSGKFDAQAQPIAAEMLLVKLTQQHTHN